jgi:hypothetical protein
LCNFFPFFIYCLFLVHFCLFFSSSFQTQIHHTKPKKQNNKVARVPRSLMQRAHTPTVRSRSWTDFCRLNPRDQLCEGFSEQGSGGGSASGVWEKVCGWVTWGLDWAKNLPGKQLAAWILLVAMIVVTLILFYSTFYQNERGSQVGARSPQNHQRDGEEG